jgi:drug/metabolite transporter (DMT)-like permease
MHSQASYNFKLGYPIALVAAVFLSTTAIFIRHLTLTYQIPALVLAFWRDVFVVVTLLLVLGLFWPHLLYVDRRHLRYLALYGLVLATFNSFWTLSVAFNGAAVATVLAYCSSAFTALLGWWLLKERLGWAKLLAVALSLGGCLLVSGALDAAAWSANLLGILTGILTGLSYAGYSLMGRAAAQRGLNPWTTLIYTFGFAALFLLVFNLVGGGVLLLGIRMPGAAARPADMLWLKDAWGGWGVLFLLAAVPTVAGFGLLNVSLKYLPSSVAQLIVSLEPVFTAVTAYFFFGELLNGIQIVGSLLILGGVVVLRLYEGQNGGSQVVPPKNVLDIPTE